MYMSYGVTFPIASFAWMFGFPACIDTFTVDLELTAYEKQSGKVVYHKRYKKKKKFPHGLYYNISFKDGFVPIIREINEEFIRGLEGKLEK